MPSNALGKRPVKAGTEVTAIPVQWLRELHMDVFEVLKYQIVANVLDTALEVKVIVSLPPTLECVVYLNLVVGAAARPATPNASNVQQDNEDINLDTPSLGFVLLELKLRLKHLLTPPKTTPWGNPQARLVGFTRVAQLTKKEVWLSIGVLVQRGREL